MNTAFEFIRDISMVAISITAILAMAAATVYACYALYRSAQFQTVGNSGLRQNNSRVSQDEFMRLLDKAAKEMIIYDDGDAVADSVYDNDRIIEAVRHKLENDHDFVVRCLFNCDWEQSKFRREFGTSTPQVQIRTRAEPGGRYLGPEPLLPHFKIVDGGLCAYMS